MQKGEKAKLQLLLSGVCARMRKNSEYFVSCDMKFLSGKKEFRASMSKQQTGWLLRYQGTERACTPEELEQFFAEEAEKYNACALCYTERTRQMEIQCGERGVQMKQTERAADAAAGAAAANPLLDDSRRYLIRIDKAASLLREIGILTAEGKVRSDMIRKYNQIDHYVELVAPMFAQLPQEEEIVLLDCACGKSYLSFVMNYYLHEVLGRRCTVIGIDINAHVIEESRRMAQRLGYHNMRFLTADLRTYTPPDRVTAVISLHACDVATDLALGVAVRAKAKLIACVPCCHKELLEQYHLPGLAPLTRHGIFKVRFNDVLTDSMRALCLEAQGYRVSVVEYISPLDSPKNLLIRATRVAKPNLHAKKEYEAVRATLGTHSTLDRMCEGERDFSWIPDDSMQE